MDVIKTKAYKTSSGKEPYTQWFLDLEKSTRLIVAVRQRRVNNGNTGACKPIKGYHGLYEIVIDYGPGYRIYYAIENPTLFILLFAGDKDSQNRDIEKAYKYLKDYLEEQP